MNYHFLKQAAKMGEVTGVKRVYDFDTYKNKFRWFQSLNRSRKSWSVGLLTFLSPKLLYLTLFVVLICFLYVAVCCLLPFAGACLQTQINNIFLHSELFNLFVVYACTFICVIVCLCELARTACASVWLLNRSKFWKREKRIQMASNSSSNSN